jgi:hypothetical protein
LPGTTPPEILYQTVSPRKGRAKFLGKNLDAGSMFGVVIGVPTVRLGGACSKRFSRFTERSVFQTFQRSNSSNRFPARKHSDNLLMPVPSTRLFVRIDLAVVDLVGRPEPKQRDGLSFYQAKLPRFRNFGNVEINQRLAVARAYHGFDLHETGKPSENPLYFRRCLSR